MVKQRILHITDLHISDLSTESKEFLRKDFYQTYLGALSELILSRIGKIDCIIATGDFIDQGKTENFPHALKVIEFLCTKLNVVNANVGVCIGNHDIKITTNPKTGEIIAEDRSDYETFERNFSLKFGQIYKNNRASISKLSENIYFMSLDAMLNRTSNKPSNIKDQEINEIVMELKKIGINTPNNLLIIGTHYPLTVFENFLFPDEDGWFDHHFWRSGGLIYERIKNDFKELKILWLFGDTHLPSEEVRNRQIIVMSGRIGEKLRITKEEKDVEHIIMNNRHARIIEYTDDNKTNIYTCMFNILSYYENPHQVSWKIGNPEEYKYELDSPVLIKCHGNEFFEDDIKGYIIKRNLYRFNRFIIGDRPDEVCLGWISINNLLGDNNGFLQSIIVHSKNWLSGLLTSEELQKTILIGIDFWGSIIACHLSVMLEIKTFCKASRGSNDDFSLVEVFNSDEQVYDFVGMENIVLISDVISSGKTLKKVYDIIDQLFIKNDLKISKAIAISVISDLKEHKRVRLNFLNHFGTFCSNIRIPIVNKEFLPDEALFPAKTYFK